MMSEKNQGLFRGKRPVVLFSVALVLGATGGAIAITAQAGDPNPEAQSTTPPPKATPVPNSGIQPVPAQLTQHDWAANPIQGAGRSQRVTNLGQASVSSGLAPRLSLKGLGSPTDIYATVKGVVGADQTVVAAVFTTTQFGPLQVLQQPAGPLTPEALRTWATGCVTCDFSKEVVLTDGTPAVVLSSPGWSTAVHWIRGGLWTYVWGPYKSLQPAAAIKAAEIVNSAP